MGKPRMIILVRHAQSEGNKNRDIHQTIPDHRVKLTAEGYRQAQDAGRRLRDLLQPDDKLHFFTSPYRRTRETTEGIIESLTSDTPSPSPFSRRTIKVYEEPRLREQDFGNFQPCSTEMERMWMERADYGHFFYRIPNGESAADAYDRVSGFNESLWRQFGEDDFANVCVLVTHGLMARVFLMKWYHWSVEYFEDLRNINHCEFLILTHNPENGKYTLQNKLRTWSDLRKDRDLENASKEQVPASIPPAGHATVTEHIPIRRKWGGCPDGCTHGLTADAKQLLRANLLNSMRQEHAYAQAKHADDHAGSFGSKLHKSISIDEVVSSSEESAVHNDTNRKSSTRHVSNTQHILRDDDNGDTTKQYESASEARPNSNPLHPKRPNFHGVKRNSEDHLLHLPTATSSASAHLKYALLHLGGRDGGGSMSGANSLAPSDDEGDDHDHHRHAAPASSSLATGNLSHAYQQHFEFPSSEQTQRPPPSQEVEDDGDDEMSGRPTEKSKKSRLHHHHHHYHHHHVSPSNDQSEHRMANILGDGDELSNHSEPKTQRPESSSIDFPSPLHIEELSLEEHQKQDQSIQGSVY
ncbi:Histidine phosphatase superfamily clade-1 [Penicillium cf. griseofulvum]|uniref:Histidine phosphatase superfamily clade-1 n=1 Tax=Penicillium cf. griseofulvum TaxID=2972120 RepID=A0A9W9J424_9EURO|nr:Histidine phosphatase superfamily clade-1 [Penicillium cf. griseofulvum]KAJ5434567.1 Histidine phosphatase superfamily clade-1 [Penicillium cf. griseofulvum]KAJ5452396.1 Histidine phosphatase superfamily clade-1 [Penicillium cf. griseofulvum]